MVPLVEVDAVAQAVLFIVVAGLVLLLAALAIFRLAVLRLESPLGRQRDGLMQGSDAPRWRLIDSARVPRQVPGSRGLQVLLFADHSIVAFAPLAAELERLRQDDLDLEAVMVSRTDTETTIAACEEVGLDIPIVVVDDRFYRQHNVWVMPHILFLNHRGKILVAGNVSEATSLTNMWRHARMLHDTERGVALQ